MVTWPLLLLLLLLLLCLTLQQVWVVVTDDVVCHKLHQPNLQQQAESEKTVNNTMPITQRGAADNIRNQVRKR
jgi:hypothetical protein